MITGAQGVSSTGLQVTASVAGVSTSNIATTTAASRVRVATFVAMVFRIEEEDMI